MRKIIILICFILACVLFISCSKKGTKIENQNEKAENSVPLRIVSLSPAATEILFAISAQDKIVARTDLCDYPKEAEKIPSVGGFDGKLFSLENIISFKPDFVYLTAVMHTHLIEPLKSYGIRVYVSNAQSLDDILKEIEDIAEITGYKENGKICVENIRSEFLQAEREVKDLNLDKPLSVYWEV